MIKFDSSLDKLFSIGPYSLNNIEKTELLESELGMLNDYHFQYNTQYRNILLSTDYVSRKVHNLSDLPYLPVRLFKELELVTNPSNSKIRSLASSGTSGQSTSKIFIDSYTSRLQTKVLAKIVSHYIGNRRIPMLVIDKPSTVQNRTQFSARAAGIVGFSSFASQITFALNEDMSPDWNSIEAFTKNHGDQPIFVFGFTSIVWEHLLKVMMERKSKIDLMNATFFHGGGWKKVSEESQVTKKYFKNVVMDHMGILNVRDYYGMAEQVGSILIECEFGFMHPSIFSEILIRNPHSLKLSEMNEVGLIQTLSILPRSYPGHVLLTEDLGRQIGVDDCACGKLGSYFQVEGRVKRAELRGCSDTYKAV